AYNSDIYFILIWLSFYIHVQHLQLYFFADARLFQIIHELSEQNYRNYVDSNRSFFESYHLKSSYSVPIRALWDSYKDPRRIKFKKKIPGFVAISSWVQSKMVLVYHSLNLAYFSMISLYCK